MSQAKREALPPDYRIAIAEVNGRFYPVEVTPDEQGTLILDMTPCHLWEVENAWGIPPAIGPQHRTGVVSFPKYAAALQFCHSHQERWALERTWKKATVLSEVYPERNAWYLDEIQTLAGMRPSLQGIGSRMSVFMFLRDGTHCFTSGDTIDDALVTFYEQLYALIQEKERPAVAI